MASTTTSSLYLVGVLVLIGFLALTSQIQFQHVPPGPLSMNDQFLFNGLVCCMLVSFWRVCTTDPGRVPPAWAPENTTVPTGSATSTRWCYKCKAYKPPRAHHCKQCARCVPKMDHHCPWTANCVSFCTFPHFIRFLFFAVAAMGKLEYLLWARLSHLWQHRSWPAYLGPSALQLAHLFLLTLVNSMTLFALILLLGRTVWSMGENITTIEGWEIERHHSLLRRARANGGFITGAHGSQVHLVRHEFPYDIGIWSNICQSMGSGNPIAWFWPFAATPAVERGLDFETNDFNDEDLSWPPPDPDRVPMPKRVFAPSAEQLSQIDYLYTEAGMQAFRTRQERDRQRWSSTTRNSTIRHRRGTTGADADDTNESSDDEQPEAALEHGSPNLLARQRWRNAEGERLSDFGVDEDMDSLLVD